jgi:hypothetical protein
VKENTYWEVADDEAIRTSANFPQKLPCICDLQSFESPELTRERGKERDTDNARASERQCERD